MTTSQRLLALVLAGIAVLVAPAFAGGHSVQLADGDYGAAGNLVAPDVGPVIWHVQVFLGYMRYKSQGSSPWSVWICWDEEEQAYVYGGINAEAWVFTSEGEYAHNQSVGQSDAGTYHSTD